MVSKKLENTVNIGIITNSEISKEDICQKFILIIYNPPYKHEKYLCLRMKEGDILPISVDTQKKSKIKYF